MINKYNNDNVIYNILHNKIFQYLIINVYKPILIDLQYMLFN